VADIHQFPGPAAPKLPARQPGEDILTWIRRIAADHLRLPVPPADPPPPPSGKLRVPRDVVPYKVRLDQIWRGHRETGEEG
jgi:hypothetical protein